MWDKPEHCKATSESRPIRVAYLVAFDDCPDLLLDAIFDESYHRWGGRRTAIIPVTSAGPDQRYAQWLHFFDPDIIYSFASLTDEAVADLHERYAPSHLIKHYVHNAKPDTYYAYRIELPTEPLSSLSVVPAFLSRPGLFGPAPERVELLNSELKREEQHFLRENFGFFSASFPSALTLMHSDLFAPLTLRSQNQMDDNHLMKNSAATYLQEESEVLAALAEPRRALLTVAGLSDMYAPYLSGFDYRGDDGLVMVVGDTPQDRVAFWNGLHSRDRTRPHEVARLRLTAAQFEDADFLTALRAMIATRAVWASSNRNDVVTLESCSLSEASLTDLAKKLQDASSRFLAIRPLHLDDPSDVIPKFRHDHSARYASGGLFEEHDARSSTTFNGRSFPVSVALPWHLREAMPPARIREGSWMVDLTVEREVDHSRFSNVRHVWMLPRRIRLERAFTLEIEGQSGAVAETMVRPSRHGEFCFAANLGQRSVVLTMPEDDIAAIRTALQSDYEWREFERFKTGAPRGRARFGWSAISDKGRYLLGVLQLFEEVPLAFRVLMDGFWRDELQMFGAAPVQEQAGRVDQLVTKIRRRLGQRTGSLTFSSESDFQRLGEVALGVAAELRIALPVRKYRELRAHWEEITAAWFAANPPPDGTAEEKWEEEARYKDPALLDRSIEYLCGRDVLFQGHEWQCQTCFNRNWVGIEALGKTMTCDVCETPRSASVSEEWHFRPNLFLLDAYRLHGTEPVVWSLWQQFRHARASFYFAPSLKLWKDYPRKDGTPWDVEIDALAVVEGRVVAVEGTRSKTLSDSEIEKLQLAAQRIRPDIMMVTCMGASPAELADLKARLAAKMPAGVEAQVHLFDPGKLDRSPYLAP